MKKYLIDANLPYYFGLWNTPEYIHLTDLNDSWADEQIWEYARENNLTIISKDADFSHWMMLTEPPPRVIHLRVGNSTIKELRQMLMRSWTSICTISDTHKLVNVFSTHIEGIS
jgi:predicted nuclease of predicted toxin-antitoxin system